MNKKPVIEVIVEAITPYVGSTMARSSIDLHCQRLGIKADSRDNDQVDKLLHQVGLGLNIFIGRDKTTAVMQQIRTQIAGGAQ